MEVRSRWRLFTGMHTSVIRGRALVVGAALVVTTTLAAGCTGESGAPGDVVAQSAAPSDRGAPAPWVLFQQDAGARYEVAMIRADGADRIAPLHDLAGGHQTNPDWSPDGRRIVFAMNDGERDDLWIADADGSHPRMLLDCTGLCRFIDDPAWSPDGRRIVYSRTKLRQSGWGTATLETVDIVTGRIRVLLGPWRHYATAGARYSPDGSRILFEKVHKTSRGPDADIDGDALVVLRLFWPGHPVEKLTDPRLFAGTADWSPDGLRIVYAGLVDPGSDAQELFVISPHGTNPTRITHVSDDGGFAAEPTWLPDGSGVLFSGRLDGSAESPELLRVRLDGSDVGPAFGDATLYGRHPRVQPPT
jgi:dipeptidyl aminopeptidase/acylaminoacyl peptidase